MQNKDRWEIAQKSEKKYWEIRGKNIEQKTASSLNWYEWRSSELKKILIKSKLENIVDGEKSILEIGCGPVGMISYFPGKYKIGIDPLNNYYESNKYLIDMRKKDVLYRKGIAEQLNFEDGSFNLIIVENCIDHVKNKEKAIDEIYRVLKREGILYLTVNCRTTFGYLMHRALSKCKIDKSHPHTFTMKKIKDFLESRYLNILYIDTYTNYKDALMADIKSKEIQNILKALSGVSEYLVRTVSIKED